MNGLINYRGGGGGGGTARGRMQNGKNIYFMPNIKLPSCVLKLQQARGRQCTGLPRSAVMWGGNGRRRRGTRRRLGREETLDHGFL